MTVAEAAPRRRGPPARHAGSCCLHDAGADAWRELIVRNPAVVLLIDPDDGRILEASRAAAAFYGYDLPALRAMHIGQINALSPAAIAGHMAEARRASPGEPAAHHFRFPHRLASGAVRIVDVYSGPVELRGRTVLQSVIHDVTEHVAAEHDRDRLAAAVEQAAEAILIADPDARIEYVNPAFERVTGYSRSEVIGQNPRILKSGAQPPELYAAMWATIASGGTWHGELVNRRRDGTLFIEEASIRAVYDRSGQLRNYVGVKRDVTAAHALQDQVDGAARDRASIAALVSDLRPLDSPEATARAICERVLSLPGISFGAIALFEPNARARPLAAIGTDRVPIPFAKDREPWSRAERRRVQHLQRQLRIGRQVEPWTDEGASPMAVTFQRLGIRWLVDVPIWVDDELVGFLQAGSSSADAEARLTELLPSLDEFGIMSSLLLGAQLDARAHRARLAAHVDRVIRRRAFQPVFQPIVSMADGSISGYEALTRFADGGRPDEEIATAGALGRGLDLEVATLEASIAACDGLPDGAWVDLNVSPALVHETARLRPVLLRARGRELVLEITEHEAIPDYASLRAAFDALGLPLRLAVDDAGAGFASLRHILELRPDMIKLDRSLIAGVELDTARQALIVGLLHFARSSGATVIAEGVEREAERTTLLSLGITLGQGHLFGRPGAAPPDGRRRPRSHPVGVRADAGLESCRSGLLRSGVVPARR